MCAAQSKRESKPYNILQIRLHSIIALNCKGVITVPVWPYFIVYVLLLLSWFCNVWSVRSEQTSVQTPGLFTRQACFWNLKPITFHLKVQTVLSIACCNPHIYLTLVIRSIIILQKSELHRLSMVWHFQIQLCAMRVHPTTHGVASAICLMPPVTILQHREGGQNTYFGFFLPDYVIIRF